MTNELVELENTQKLCKMLMNTPHYKRLGADGIWAVVETAKSVGIDPLQALNGGMYVVKGKIEMSSAMMNAVIRSKGHSITKDKRSDDNICILHGKRADNGDTWVESFSIEDAKRAGISNNATWRAYQKDMLFARALSRLARQLFPDVIKGCYVQGEIAMDTAISSAEPATVIEMLGHEGAEQLEQELGMHPAYRDQVHEFLKKQGLEMYELDPVDADKIYAKIDELRK